MKIYLVHYNKPEYIKIQKNTIDNHVKFDYEIIVVDNSINMNIKNEICNISNELGIRYIYCHNKIPTAESISHQNSFKYILNDIQEGNDVMILDHDIFLINDLKSEYFSDYEMTFHNQTRGHVSYPWPGLMIFNNIRHINDISFYSGVFEGCACDTGGEMYKYINKHKPTIKYIGKTDELTDTSQTIQIYDNIFIHLVSGSNWNHDYNLKDKIEYIKNKYKLS